MKNRRHEIILSLIDRYEIDTQAALMEKLCEEGIEATQTTLSRDIRALRLVKVQTEKGTYKYVRADAGSGAVKGGYHRSISSAILTIESAGNIVVVRTHAGMANAVAVSIDTLAVSSILGSVAGDDTILLVVRREEEAVSLKQIITEQFGL